jgi:hypothetical protein
LDRISSQFISGPNFGQPDHEDPIRPRLDSAIVTLNKLIAKGNISHTETQEALEVALGASPVSFINTHAISNLKSRIKDTLVALRQIGVEESTGHAANLSLNLRLFETLEKVVIDNSFPFDGNDLSKWLSRPILAPTLVEYKSILSDFKARTEAIKNVTAQANRLDAHIKSLYDKRLELKDIMAELKTVPIRHQFTQPPVGWEPTPPPDRFSKTNLDTQRLNFVTKLADLSVKHLERSLSSAQGSIHLLSAGASDAVPTSGKLETATGLSSDFSALVNLSKTMLDQFASFGTQESLTSYKPLDVVPFSLKRSALETFSPKTNELLKEKGIDVTEVPHQTLIKQVQEMMDDNAAQLDVIYKPYVAPKVTGVQLVGDTTIRKMSSVSKTWADAWNQGDLQPPSITSFYQVNSLSESPTLGKFTVLGRADLLVVKQQLIGYEGGDVAYIENVLKGETKSREVTRSEKMETESFLETETTTSKETEIGSSQRFEMSDETAKVIKETTSLKAGVTVSASYGPFVSITGNVSGSRDRTSEESIKAASEFSKEVTNKATEKIQNRVLQRQKLTKTIESVDKDLHRFSNTGGSDHVSGVYQWQNKVYEAQTWNYGQRTILDFMIPEPGAFLFDKAANPETTKTDDIKYIPPFTATLADITREKYMEFAQTYGVPDLEQPPDAKYTISAQYSGQTGSPGHFSEKLQIDPGFKAVKVYVGVEGVNADGGTPQITVICVSFVVSYLLSTYPNHF